MEVADLVVTVTGKDRAVSSWLGAAGAGSSGTRRGVVGAGLFRAEPQGVALWPCGEEGYWVLTDQLAARSLFVVLDRRTIAPPGSFTGALTANHDGIGLTQGRLEAFPHGALYAVDDDQSVTAVERDRIVSRPSAPAPEPGASGSPSGRR